MKATDYFKLKVERGELSTEDALKQSLQLLDDSSLFIDSLIEKYTELKSMTLKNLKQFDGHTKHEWYDATFTNTLLFIWDLEDIKCRSCMSGD